MSAKTMKNGKCHQWASKLEFISLASFNDIVDQIYTTETKTNLRSTLTTSVNITKRGLLKQTISLQTFLKAIFHKFYLVHLSIFCLKCFLFLQGWKLMAARKQELFNQTSSIIICQNFKWPSQIKIKSIS